MNYLAHAYLSFGNPGYLVGNFLGDFVRNKDLEHLPEAVVKGVMLHRQIDAYTDAHPLILAANRRLYSRHSKYAGVIMDIFCDYLLSVSWQSFSDAPMRDYINDAYGVYRKFGSVMPPSIRNRMEAMVADDWLWKYQHYHGLEKTFFYLKRRVSKPQWIEGALESLRSEEAILQELFDAFFPELVAYAGDLILQSEKKW